ncbi:MAG: tetratricopeptide repeat protein [Defluviicoccus sp.]|nr:MAG: tetratricopeptide repeat protein [Defluviicoccus sp.]
MAAQHRAHQRFNEAEALYRSVLEKRPNHLPALLGLGTCARQHGDRLVALTWFRKAAAAHPNHPQPLLETATEHHAQGQVDEAEILYRSVLKISPNHLTAMLSLGTCARQRGDFPRHLRGVTLLQLPILCIHSRWWTLR